MKRAQKKKERAVTRAPSCLCLYFIRSNFSKLAMTTAGMTSTSATARVTSSSPTTEVATPTAGRMTAAAVTRRATRAAVTWHTARTAVAGRAAVPTVATIRGAAHDRLMHIQLRTRVSAAVTAGVAA